jgi:hypothetical protein
LNGFSDSQLKVLVKGLHIDIERDRAGWHQWDEGTILASEEEKFTSIFIGFNIELAGVVSSW